MEPISENLQMSNRGGVAEAVRRETPIAERAGGMEAATARQWSNVSDTPDNRRRVESAIHALDILKENSDNTRYQFRMHSESGKLQVALVNFMTGEVVEEIPSSKLLEFASAIEDLTGLVLEKRA